MSDSTTRQRRPRLGSILSAIIAALSAALVFAGGVAANLLAPDLGAVLQPYWFWVWTVLIAAFVVTIAVAVIGQIYKLDAPQEEQARESKPHPAPRQTILDGEVKDGTLVVRIPTPVNALHQLPPPPRDFTGRVRELDELMSQIEGGGVTISGLQGLGGVGKTALALKLAERLAPRSRTHSST